jgi:hypothetical protein
LKSTWATDTVSKVNKATCGARPRKLATSRNYKRAYMSHSSETGFQIAVAGGARAADAAPPLPGVEWLECRVDAAAITFVRDGSVVARIDIERPKFELPRLLGLIVVADAELYARLADFWGKQFAAAALKLILIPQSSAEALTSAAVAVLSSQLGEQLTASGEAALALAQYRGEFDRLQHSFARLEEFVAAHSLHNPRLLFEYGVAAKSPAITHYASDARPAEGSERRLLQDLPVDSLGVCAIGLYLREGARLPLHIQLCALETAETYGSWRIDAANSQPGWLSLQLMRAIDEPALSLRLIIDSPAHAEEPALAFGPPHPYEEFRARDPSGPGYDSPLAFRVFTCLPGVQVAGLAGGIVSTSAEPARILFLPREVYTGVTQMEPPPAENPPGLVSYDPVSGLVTVHPPGEGRTTVARLRVRVPATPARVTAEIVLDHEKANPTQFAILATYSDSDARALVSAGTLGGPSFGFSGWTTLSALERTTVCTFVPRAEQRALSVYLLTRQERDVSSEYAWARFARFELHNLPLRVHADAAQQPLHLDAPTSTQ